MVLRAPLYQRSLCGLGALSTTPSPAPTLRAFSGISLLALTSSSLSAVYFSMSNFKSAISSSKIFESSFAFSPTSLACSSYLLACSSIVSMISLLSSCSTLMISWMSSISSRVWLKPSMVSFVWNCSLDESVKLVFSSFGPDGYFCLYFRGSAVLMPRITSSRSLFSSVSNVATVRSTILSPFFVVIVVECFFR